MKYFYLLLLIPVVVMAQNKSSQSILAESFINSLDSVQRGKAAFPMDEMSRYDWNYLPPTLIPRQGVCLKNLDDNQKNQIYNLLHSFLSDKGYEKTQEIMSNEYYLKELEPENINRIPENYYAAFYGNPERDSIWGWKFSGHHVALNFTTVNNQLAYTPFFFGIYPAEIKTGKNKGKRIMKDEEDLGFELINMLSDKQRSTSIFQLKAFSDIVTGSSIEVGPLEHAGIKAKDLTNPQKNLLNKIIACYLASMPSKIAEARIKRIATEDFGQITFGWAGGLRPGEAHYYRVQGKTFLIEFDNTQHKANHIHAVWRDFKGDFGTDLLKEHYKTSKHHHH